MVTAELEYGIFAIIGYNHKVLAFARYTENEIGVVAANFSNEVAKI